MNTELTVDEACAAYQATLQTWLHAYRANKRGQLSDDDLRAADAAVELATAHYSAALERLKEKAA